MTTEDDFQNALDANPEDWHTRLVFADWLQDRDDPRAEGHRALGVLRKRAYIAGLDNDPDEWAGAAWIATPAAPETYDDKHKLPLDWFELVDIATTNGVYKPRYGYTTEQGVLSAVAVVEWRRRVVEDRAALAFAQLPAKRRAELLAVPAVLPKRATRRKKSTE